MPKSFARSLEEIQSSKTWSAAVMPAGRLVAQSATTTAFQVSTVVTNEMMNIILYYKRKKVTRLSATLYCSAVWCYCYSL